jgi:hypothetical protein
MMASLALLDVIGKIALLVPFHSDLPCQDRRLWHETEAAVRVQQTHRIAVHSTK